MSDTIDKEPERFWYYNNGITIIAEEFDVDKDVDSNDIVELYNFSIINGAQTVSTLGAYLKDAELTRDEQKIEKLKKTFVLTRIVEIKQKTELRNTISIYNNTQNPISTRDMASNRSEQKELQNWLLDNKPPQIYVEIKRGQSSPGKYFHLHQKTNNELLAQLAFAGFLESPSVAKDKKSTIFNNDFSSDFIVNKFYEQIFNHNATDTKKYGVLFEVEKYQIDELLFIYHLHNELRNT